MKPISVLFVMLLLCIQLVANTTIFDEEKYQPNTIIVCFDASAINSTRGEINVEKTRDGQIRTGLSSFDAKASELNLTKMERMFTVKDKDWCDKNGVYPMNIFKLTVDS
jgi:hypothetical protein